MKLTKAIKNKIIEEVISKKYEPLKKALDEKIKVQVEAYIIEKTKKHKDFISSAPEGWLFETTEFNIYFGETTGGGEWFDISFNSPFTIPFSWRGSYTKKGVIRVEDDKWRTIFSNLKKEEISNTKYKEELAAELHSFLAGVNTIKQLTANLPEVGEFINLKEFMPYLPVVQTEKLKKLLRN